MKFKLSKEFKKIITLYILSFFGFHLIYSLLNWWLTEHLQIVHVNEKYTDVLIPIILCFLISYIVFLPLIKKINFHEKISNFTIWILIPLSIGMSTALSQNYYKNYNDKAITIEKTTDILNYPNEKYFYVKKFFVAKDQAHILKQSHTSGKRRRTLVVSHYITSAMYNDSTEQNTPAKVGYGIHNTERIFNNQRKEKKEIEIQKFDSTSFQDYHNHNFYSSNLFQRHFDSDDAKYFNESWTRNSHSDKNSPPIVIEKLNRKLADIKNNDREIALYASVISLSIGLVLLTFFELIKRINI